MRGLRQLTMDGNELEDQAGLTCFGFSQGEHAVSCEPPYESNAHSYSNQTPMERNAFYRRLNRSKRRVLIEKHMPLSLLPRVLEESTQDPDAVLYLIHYMRCHTLSNRKQWIPRNCMYVVEDESTLETVNHGKQHHFIYFEPSSAQSYFLRPRNISPFN
jgi:hypothetical protein